MHWSTINFKESSQAFAPAFSRQAESIPFLNLIASEMQKIADTMLYKSQHDGKKIYLEKMLNEAFTVSGYNPNDHEDTKLIYIDDTISEDQLYIWQDLEEPTSFLEDDGDDNEDDVFLVGDNEESETGYSWIIYMPDTISFQEYALRALVDSYRYAGKKYTIEIYTP